MDKHTRAALALARNVRAERGEKNGRNWRV